MASPSWLFDTAALTPHGFCLTWEPGLLWLDAGADALTAAAYFSIPLAVLWFVRRREDLPHRWMALLFAAFIVACGSTHVMGVITLWVPAYNAELMTKLVTATLSIITAASLWPVVPSLLLLPSPSRLEKLNQELQGVRDDLETNNKGLDRLVNERTEQLLRLNETIRRSEERFRRVVEATPSAVVMVDASGHIEMINRQTERMFGYSRAELLGCPIEVLIPTRFHDVHPGLRTAYCEDPQARPMAGQSLLYGVNKNGSEFEVEVGLNPIDTEDGLKVLSAIVDISERVRTTEKLERHLKQASLAKSRFLASVSHELRTPLNGILGYAQLLQIEGSLDQTQKTRIEAMLGAGQHLLDVINGVLDLSEIEAERLQLRVAQFDIADSVRKCVAFVQPNAAEKQLRLDVSFDAECPRQVMGDRTRLQQVLTNMLGNAVKFTPRGSVSLRIEAGTEPGTVTFMVADTGPGIPASQLARIFREFERLETHIIGAVEGSGLGLALCVRLAALMGGSLHYKDNPDGGSVFSLEVPLPACATVELPAATPAAGASRPASQPERPLRILVVDDIALNRDVASSFLLTAGHNVAVAEDGGEAVDAVAADDYDLVLMDVRMPEVDGLEATRRIRSLGGARGAVPIIGLTAQAFVQQIHECRIAGMDGHLSKPFTLEGLLATVRQAVEAASSRHRPEGRADATRSPVAAAIDPEPSSGSAMPSDLPHAPAAAPVQPWRAPAPPNAGSPANAALKVFDQEKFTRTVVHLTPELVLSSLQTLSEQAERLLGLLLNTEPQAVTTSSLAAAAHTLAGSAGMFGFDRLCTIALLFEHAVESGTPEAQLPTAELIAVLTPSMDAIQSCRANRVETSNASAAC